MTPEERKAEESRYKEINRAFTWEGILSFKFFDEKREERNVYSAIDCIGDDDPDEYNCDEG